MSELVRNQLHILCLLIKLSTISMSQTMNSLPALASIR